MKQNREQGKAHALVRFSFPYERRWRRLLLLLLPLPNGRMRVSCGKKSKHIDQKIAQAERENTLNPSAKCLVGVAVVVCAVICVNGCCCFCCWCIVHVLRYRVHVVGCVLPHQGRWLKWIFVRLFITSTRTIRWKSVEYESGNIALERQQQQQPKQSHGYNAIHTPHNFDVGTRFNWSEWNLWLCATDSTQYSSRTLSPPSIYLCRFFFLSMCVIALDRNMLGSCLSLQHFAYGKCVEVKKRWIAFSTGKYTVVSVVQYEPNLLTVFSVLCCALCCVCCVYPILCSFCFFPWVRPSYIIQFHFSLHTVFALTRSNLSAALKTQHQNTTETKHFFEKKTNNTTSTTVTSNQQQQPTKKKIIRLNFHQ